MKVRFERTVKQPHYKAGVEGDTVDLPQHVALELAAEGYVTLLEEPVHVPTPKEKDEAEAAHNREVHESSGDLNESGGIDSGV